MAVETAGKYYSDLHNVYIDGVFTVNNSSGVDSTGRVFIVINNSGGDSTV